VVKEEEVAGGSGERWRWRWMDGEEVVG